MTVRVLIADDHPVFLDGLRMLLESTGTISVVGAALDGDGLLRLAAEVTCDVVVADLDMPGVDGATATRALTAAHPDLPVLVLTMHDDDAAVQRALRAGARGYVLKGASHGAIVRAVHGLADGQTVLHGSIGTRVVRAATAAGPGTAFPDLSARELEVLNLVARGLGNQEIAQRLFLSTKTVQNRVSALLAKTGSATRAQLVARGRDAGLGAPR